MELSIDGAATPSVATTNGAVLAHAADIVAVDNDIDIAAADIATRRQSLVSSIATKISCDFPCTQERDVTGA